MNKLIIETKEGKREFDFLINPNCGFIDNLINDCAIREIKSEQDQPRLTKHEKDIKKMVENIPNNLKLPIDEEYLKKQDQLKEQLKKEIAFDYLYPPANMSIINRKERKLEELEQKQEFPIVFKNEKFVITLLERSMVITEKIELNQVCFFYKQDFDLLIKAILAYQQVRNEVSIDTWKEMKWQN